MLRRDVAEPAGAVAEQEEADDLEDPLAGPRVHVADVAELLDRRRLDARLLGHLAKRGQLRALPRSDQALRQRPDPLRLSCGADCSEHDPPSQPPYDHTSRRELPSHGDFVTQSPVPACTRDAIAARMPWHSDDESAKRCHKVVWTGGGWMNLQPLGDRLIVEVLEEEETTISGIVLPDTAKEKPQRGRVLAVGPGARDEDGDHIAMDLEEGDEIIFSKYGGTEIKLGTDEVLILRESDVLAKVVGDRELAGTKS